MHCGPVFSAEVSERLHHREWQSSVNISNKPKMPKDRGKRKDKQKSQIPNSHPVSIPRILFSPATELCFFSEPLPTRHISVFNEADFFYVFPGCPFIPRYRLCFFCEVEKQSSALERYHRSPQVSWSLASIIAFSCNSKQTVM